MNKYNTTFQLSGGDDGHTNFEAAPSGADVRLGFISGMRDHYYITITLVVTSLLWF